MVALAHSRTTSGEQFQFGSAHSEYCFDFLSLAGENGFDRRNGRGAETGSGFGDCIHGMGWDGMGFTLRREWAGTLSKGRKRRRKRNNRTDGKRPNVPNRETVEWQCIHGVFLRFECAEFYLCGGRVGRVSLSWDLDLDLIGFDWPLFPTFSDREARGIKGG